MTEWAAGVPTAADGMQRLYCAQRDSAERRRDRGRWLFSSASRRLAVGHVLCCLSLF